MVSSGGSIIVLLTGAKYHPNSMRIELRDSKGRRLSRVEVDERSRPARIQVPGSRRGGSFPDLYPIWDEALDDAGLMRRCVVCGCPELYARRNLPRVTPFILVLAFSGVAVAALGYATNPVVNAALVVLLVLDALTLVFARWQLACYRCGTVYHGVRVARYLRPWDRAIAERIAKEPTDLPTVLIEPAAPAMEAGADSARGGEA
jgi:Flp pilus assembly protein TadB